jgi:hypothetical protein
VSLVGERAGDGGGFRGEEPDAAAESKALSSGSEFISNVYCIHNEATADEVKRVLTQCVAE